MTQEFTISLPANKVVSGVVLHFFHTRSLIHGLRRADGASQILRSQHGTSFVLDWATAPLAGPVEVRFTVEFEGELPALREWTWIDPAEGRIEPFSVPGVREDFRAGEDPLSGARSSTEEFLLRQRAIRNLPRSDRRHHDWFFYDLDLATHSGLPHNECTRTQLRELGTTLYSRVRFRAVRSSAFATPVHDTPIPPLAGDRLTFARSIAGLMRFLIERHFGSPSGDVDFRDLGAAFDGFAEGRLCLEKTHGAPNGEFFFLFAEFVAAVLEILDGEPSSNTAEDARTRVFWEQCLRVFVRAAEVFASTYAVAACSVNPTRVSYRRFSPQNWDDLALRYAPLHAAPLGPEGRASWLRRLGAIVCALDPQAVRASVTGRRAGGVSGPSTPSAICCYELLEASGDRIPPET